MTVCVPLIGVNHTAVIGITTPDNEFNYCSELMDLKSVGGVPLFKSIKIGLTCSLCTRRGIVICTHEVPIYPHWKSAGNQEKQQAIMAGDSELMARETRGIVVSKRQFVFQPYLAMFAIRPTYDFTYPVQYAAIGIDPAAGSTCSQYAFSVVTSFNSKYPILALDGISSKKRNECYQMIFDNIKSLRSFRQYERTYFAVFIEANLNQLDCTDLATRLENVDEFGPVHCYRYHPDKNDDVGVFTTADDKQLYARDMQRVLSDAQLCYATNMGGEQPRIDKNKREFMAQLHRFHKEVREAPDLVFNANKIGYSGKSGPGKGDDLVLATQIALTNLIRWKSSLAFQRLANEMGWN